MSMFAVFASSPALATHVTPEFQQVIGNSTCADFEGLGQTWIELKMDPPVNNGTVFDANLSVTITNFNGKTFDWSANFGEVDAVFVKAGNAGSNLYRYDPTH